MREHNNWCLTDIFRHYAGYKDVRGPSVPAATDTAFRTGPKRTASWSVRPCTAVPSRESSPGMLWRRRLFNGVPAPRCNICGSLPSQSTGTIGTWSRMPASFRPIRRQLSGATKVGPIAPGRGTKNYSFYFEKGCPQGQIRSERLNSLYGAEWYDPRSGIRLEAGSGTVPSNQIGLMDLPPFSADADRRWGLTYTALYGTRENTKKPENNRIASKRPIIEEVLPAKKWPRFVLGGFSRFPLRWLRVLAAGVQQTAKTSH